MCRVPFIGVLGSKRALEEPIRDAGARITPEALEALYEVTQGYPYFLQEWGYQVWNTAPASPITADVVDVATQRAAKRLDENFFRVRFDRLTPSEKRCLRAMAEFGPGPYRTGEVASALGYRSSTRLSQVRRSLLLKGMIYSPTHGAMAFTVPLFDAFMRRAMPDHDPP